MRILAISGSLRARSSNKAALQAAALLAPVGMIVTLFSSIADLPHFNPDDDGDAPPAPVLRLRREIGGSDGLLLCSPEYARGVAGCMKNALDWLVGSSEFPGKPVALINASPRAGDADSSLRLILRTMSARLVADASISLPLFGRNLDAAAIAADETLSAKLRTALDHLAVAIKERGSDH